MKPTDIVTFVSGNRIAMPFRPQGKGGQSVMGLVDKGAIQKLLSVQFPGRNFDILSAGQAMNAISTGGSLKLKVLAAMSPGASIKDIDNKALVEMRTGR